MVAMRLRSGHVMAARPSRDDIDRLVGDLLTTPAKAPDIAQPVER
jgi:hypothetical protein